MYQIVDLHYIVFLEDNEANRKKLNDSVVFHNYLSEPPVT